MRGLWYIKLCKFLSRLGLHLPGSIFYIGGSDTLPAPLSKEEERELLQQWEKEGPQASIRSKLIEHNLRLVVYIARRFENSGWALRI